MGNDRSGLSRRAMAGILLLALPTFWMALGGSSRLSYHEAIVAQGARELLEPGRDWLIPTLGGRPWLEKPPLAHWLVAGVGGIAGRVNETTARIPSALAATVLALIVGSLASRRFGPSIGLLAGLVQGSTAWAIVRGRLADADILLACLVAGTLLVFERLRAGDEAFRFWRWAFFGLLGATALAKGIGFGAVLVVSALAALVLWDRDRATARRLLSPTDPEVVLGWALAGVIALAWPLVVAWKHPEVWDLWAVHVTDRLSTEPQHFAGDPLGQFLLAPLVMVLPWTPLALWGAGISLRRAWRDRGGPDRLLWAWALVPLVFLSMATVKSDHYLIHALPPWSIWSAFGLKRLGDRLRERRGWSPGRLRGATWGLFGTLGMLVGLGHLVLVPRFDDRGREWAWYATAADQIGPEEPLVLLYDWDGPDPWDRLPYPTPYGPIPHDLAVRLFYLDRDRPPRWVSGVDRLAAHPIGPGPFNVIGRARDQAELERLGRVEPIANGPDHRWDRTYVLFRVLPAEAAAELTSSR